MRLRVGRGKGKAGSLGARMDEGWGQGQGSREGEG